MGKSVRYVGLDVHKMSVDVALAEAGSAGEIRYYGRLGGDLEALDKVVRKLGAQGSELRFAYEAGPCGYQVYRHLTAKGFTVKNSWAVWSRRLRLLPERTAGGGCSTFFILGGETFGFHERLAAWWRPPPSSPGAPATV